MNKLLILFFLICNKEILVAQNLLRNGDFEEYYYCPPDYGDTFPCKYWTKREFCTTDYYNACSQEPDFGVPKNWNGTILPKKGNAYIGLIALTYDGGMEYLTGQLIEPLKKGKQYKISFWVRFADSVSFYAAKGIGIYLSKQIVFEQSVFKFSYNEVLTYKDKAQVKYDDFISDSSWHYIEGLYNAEGGESFASIGLFWNDDAKLSRAVSQLNSNYFKTSARMNFRHRLQKTFLKKNPNYVSSKSKKRYQKERYAYYLFDDIKIEPSSRQH